MKKILFLILPLLFFIGCKPMIEAKISEPNQYFKKTFNANPETIKKAVSWAFQNAGYPITNSSETTGMVESNWVPVTAGSHYIDVFGRKDSGITGAYQQMIARIETEDSKTIVFVGSRTKSLVAYLKSSGIEERKILDNISNYLRNIDPKITNIGVE